MFDVESGEMTEIPVTFMIEDNFVGCDCELFLDNNIAYCGVWESKDTANN